eukprot:10629721-Alexandrium_andersonii.AAC.1
MPNLAGLPLQFGRILARPGGIKLPSGPKDYAYISASSLDTTRGNRPTETGNQGHANLEGPS